MTPTERKQPGEQITIDMEFAPRLRSGRTLSSVTSVTITPVTSPPAVAAGAVVSGTVMQARYSGGVTGTRYLVEAVCVDSTGDVVYGEAILQVEE